MATGTVADPGELLEIDFAALDAGLPSAVAGVPHVMTTEPVLLVCTNGKRDQCCATRGRQVAVSADARARRDAQPGVCLHPGALPAFGPEGDSIVVAPRRR